MSPSLVPESDLDRLAAWFERALVDYMARAGADAVPNLHDAAAFALGIDTDDPRVRGKRVRPALCLLSAEALGAPPERAVGFALAIELMHNFCLVHDDIEDGDAMRRGRESLWKRIGVPHAINAGDWLLVMAQRAALEEGEGLDDATRLSLGRLLGRTLDRTHVGQALDMNARSDRDFGIESYMRLVREKTGHYLAAPVRGGAIVAGADAELGARIDEMASFLGPVFQIADDLIDLTDGKGREVPGSDVREGKRSFMVAHAAERCSEADRTRLFDVLDKPRDATTDEDVAWATALFERCGSIAAGRAECRALHDRALPAMRALPEPLAAALGPVFEGLVDRRR